MNISYERLSSLLVEACEKLDQLKGEYKYIPYPGYGYITVEYSQLSK